MIEASQSVNLVWNAYTGPNLSGYRIHYGTTSCNGQSNCLYAFSVFVPASKTNTTINNLTTGPGITNYFAISAVAIGGTESSRSEEIPYTGGNTIPSAPILTESVVVTAPNPAGTPEDTEEVLHAGADLPGGNDPDVDLDLSVAGPRLEIVPFGNPAVAFWIRVDAPANKSCELQISEDLQTWRVLEPFTTGASSQRMEFVDLPSPENRRYYRLSIQ